MNIKTNALYVKIYKTIDFYTGKIEYKIANSEDLEVISRNDNFKSWCDYQLSLDDAILKCFELNEVPFFEDTKYTRLIKRIKYRLDKNILSPVDDVSALSDLNEMVQILRHASIPGW